jgi:hypothetical protein
MFKTSLPHTYEAFLLLYYFVRYFLENKFVSSYIKGMKKKQKTSKSGIFQIRKWRQSIAIHGFMYHTMIYA